MKNLSKSLNEYSGSIYSQFGEDGIINEILHRIGGDNLDKWCAEFGAKDGVLHSNTCNLIKNRNYKAVLIEAEKKYYNKLCKNFALDEIVKINKFVNFEGNDSLEKILQLTKIPKNFDLLSIDIDGCDYFIFKNLEIYRPKILCIEFNHLIPNEVEFIQKKNFKIKQGSSAKSIIKLAKKKNYSLVGCTLSNLFFIENNLKNSVIQNDEIQIEDIRDDKEIKNLIFCGYDGTLYTTQPIELSWHKLKVDNKKLQILPFYLRTFPDDFNIFQKIFFLLFREFLFPGRFIKKIINFFNKK